LVSDEATAEEEEEIIQKAAEAILRNKMVLPAILLLETSKPVAYIGSQMGRFFISPFLMALGDDAFTKSEKFLSTFEKRENIEKLIRLIEDGAQKKN